MGDANIPQRSHLHRQDVLMPCDQADMGFGEMQSSLQFVYGQHASAQNELTLLPKQWRAAVESAAREHIWMQCTSIRSHMNYTLARCVTCKQGVCQSSLCQATAFCLGKCKCCVLVLATVLVCCPHPVHKHSWFLANAYKRG